MSRKNQAKSGTPADADIHTENTNREKEKKRIEQAKQKREQALRRREEKLIRIEQEKKRREEKLRRVEQNKLRIEEEKKRRAEQKAAVDEKNRIAAQKRLEKRRKVYAAIINKLKHGDYAFSYKNRGVIPRVEIEATGDAASVLTRLTSSGIKITDLEKSGGKFRFKVQKKELGKAIAFLDEMCYNYKLGETYGLTRAAKYWLARVGVVAGLAASALATYISYSHIYAVNVSGNKKIRTDAVLGVLAEAGISSGTKKSAIDLDKVVAIVNGIDGIADCDCTLTGTALYINVLESKDFTEIESFGAYKSEYDAVVTRVVIRSGTAKVKRGDTVKRGDILADGVVYSTAGEPLYTSECEGEIFGNVSIGYDVSVSPIAIEYRRTGRSHKKSAVTLFGKTFFMPKSPYASYEKIAYTANYDVLIPLYVTTYEFFETEPVEVERTVDELAEELAEVKREQLGFYERDKFEMTYTAQATETGLINIHMFFSGEALISRGCAAPVSSMRE